MTLVFQYGSNCLDSEINGERRLKGDAEFLDIAEAIEDFELAFDVWSKRRRCAAADLVSKRGSKVWGALYEVPTYLIDRTTAKERNRTSFDEIEGEGENYKREHIDVRRSNGEVARALTYIVKRPQCGLETSAEYVGLIVSGLRERGAADRYISEVKAIAAANNPRIVSYIEKL